MNSTLVGRTYFIKIFGCQMNYHDGERIAGLLESYGCVLANDIKSADIVTFITCCVREAADVRLKGQVVSMKNWPAPIGGKRVVAVGGCIGQRDGEALFEELPNLDVVFGTHSMGELPALLAQAFEDEQTHAMVREQDREGEFSTLLPINRESDFMAWIPITAGCDNYCSYCIVPYVRGHEHSRKFEDIIEEVKDLVAKGYKEINFLGQNVNSYGRDLYGEPRFAELLRQAGATGIDRIRFTSSHPKDLSDDTIAAIAETPAVMPAIQLAVQSGSDKVLADMNRIYTRASYLETIRKLKEAVPDVALITDFIVGFPGETEEDFQQTIDLVNEVKYAQAYTFLYSPREGTPAAKMKDDTPHEVIQNRFNRLVDVVKQNVLENNLMDVGKTVPVLIEGLSKKDKKKFTGRTPRNQICNFTFPDYINAQDMIGSIVDVKICAGKTWHLMGSMVEDLAWNKESPK